MSRFKFKATFETHVRTIELERQKYDLQILKEKAQKAFNLPQVTIRYTSSSGEAYFINTEAQLQKALKDAVKARYVEVKVFRDTGAQSNPAPAAVSASPAHAAPPAASHSAPAPAHASVSPSAPSAASASSAPKPGVLLSFHLPAQSGGPDRVAVDAQQNNDHFLFELKPSRYDTEVDVKLDGAQLLYLTSHSVHEDNAVKTIKGTQGISLPFTPAPNTISIHGQKIKIMFP